MAKTDKQEYISFYAPNETPDWEPCFRLRALEQCLLYGYDFTNKQVVDDLEKKLANDYELRHKLRA